MGRRNLRKLAKQRKKQKAKRHRRPPRPVVLPCRGDKYKTDELVPWVFSAEVGIYESYVMTGRRFADYDVRAALEELVVQIRGGMVPIPAEDSGSSEVVEGTENLIVWNIRRNWQRRARLLPSPGRDNLVGVLRTLLGSIEVWGSSAPGSSGYLQFVEKFLKDAGVWVREVPPDTEVLPMSE